MKRPFSVRNENLSFYQRLANLKDSQGVNALTAPHLRIVEYIGSFTRRLGCFATNFSINKETINAKSPKTLKRHLQYLLAINAISLKEEQDGDKKKRILRLEAPEHGVLSQKDFRVASGMPEYSYAMPQAVDVVEEVKTLEESQMDSDRNDDWDDCFYIENQEQNTPQNEDVFFELGGNKFAESEDIFAAKMANFAPILSKTTNETTKKEKQIPPKVPPCGLNLSPAGIEVSSMVQGFAGSLRDPEAQPNNRLSLTAGQTAGLPNDGGFVSMSKEENNEPQGEEFSVPLLKKKRHAKPKNAQERRAEAIKLSNAGHLANPVSGIKDMRKKRLIPSNACPIKETGKVTTPQLWRHLTEAWTKAFGDNALERMISNDKTYVEKRFADLQQSFIDTCNGFNPSHRELAEYFDWFLDPARVSKLLAAEKYADPNNPTSIMHFQKMFGGVFIRRFYETVISKKKLDAGKISEVSVADEAILMLEEYYDKLRKTSGDDFAQSGAMIQAGYALTAQYFHDEKQQDESQCKQRIIELMVERIIKSVDKNKAVEHLKMGIVTTKEHASLLRKETCIWFDWQEKTKDLIEIAIQKSGVNIDDRQNSDPSPSGNAG